MGASMRKVEVKDVKKMIRILQCNLGQEYAVLKKQKWKNDVNLNLITEEKIKRLCLGK